MTNKINIPRASSIGNCHPPKLTIEIHEQICDVNSLNEARELHAGQATKLADALFESLPGGTVDALLVELMRRKVSLFSVPFVGA